MTAAVTSLPVEGLPSSKAAATRSGSTMYFNGTLCPLNHMAPRYTRGGRCVICTRQANVQNFENRRVTTEMRRGEMTPARLEAINAGETTYNGKPCKSGHTLRFSASANCVACCGFIRQRDNEKRKWARISRLYGLTKSGFDQLWSDQAGTCPICIEPLAEPSTHIDHCHSTGRVRGLLCGKCNQAIGLLSENPEHMQRAARYVCS